ncbi:MAG: AAA family ATPase [Eubacteriaceae bacterium]|nr:AAA family ATPase [Eubacteriaceae bacterium]
MDYTQRTIKLFEYIKDLIAMKYTAVSNIARQPWSLPFSRIPKDTDNIRIYYRETVDAEPDFDTTILEVIKPEYTDCPVPPASIRGMLAKGWKNYAIDLPAPMDSIGDAGIQLQYNLWNVKRQKWQEAERAKNSAAKLFTELFELYTELERESESLELVLGEGSLSWANGNDINHPVLLKRANLEFDLQENTIRITDSDSSPELYSALLQRISVASFAAIQKHEAELAENEYHPLDRLQSALFLKRLANELAASAGGGLSIAHGPVFFLRKRIDGTIKCIESILKDIKNGGQIPRSIVDLVSGGEIDIHSQNSVPTLEEQFASLSGESESILLAKEANREQLEIAKRIQDNYAVLVQGPPGTGKTHTIANLLGHFLSQGKSVLVASQTKKALSVLKSQIPAEIQDLCVTALDGTNKDMVSSVEGISEKLSRYSATSLERQINDAQQMRKAIIANLADARRQIFKILKSEYTPIIIKGKGYLPIEAARFLTDNRFELSYIPGPVEAHAPLPLALHQLRELYGSNAKLSVEDQLEFEANMPSPNEILPPSVFDATITRRGECVQEIAALSEDLGLECKVDIKNSQVLDGPRQVVSPAADSEALLSLHQYAIEFAQIDGWMVSAAIDGKRGGGYRGNWLSLVELIEKSYEYSQELASKTFGKKIKFYSVLHPAILKESIGRLASLQSKTGKVPRSSLVFDKQLSTAYKTTINGKPLSTPEDFELAAAVATQLEMRLGLALCWDELMAKTDKRASFSNLGEEPEEICARRIPAIKRYLDWQEAEYSALLERISLAGLNPGLVFPEPDLDFEFERLGKILMAIKETLPSHIKIANLFLEIQEIDSQIAQCENSLSNESSPVCHRMLEAMRKREANEYDIAFKEYSAVYAKSPIYNLRASLLAQLEASAPDWALAISNRVGIHGKGECPENIQDAWKWKQFDAIIAGLHNQSLDAMIIEQYSLATALRKKTGELASLKAWLQLLHRTEKNLDLKQALEGWKLTVKKIGKGTGKNAPMLRKQAKEQMARCQMAVPAWIMPISEAIDTLDPAANKFDVLIIDEASQSGIDALAILYMAKRVIVVGDDKQVSPMAVGIDSGQVYSLQQKHISDVFQNWHLYDATTSLYDIVGTTFPSLMLQEHFRCVPEIIGYSNKLSYDMKIKPLRDGSGVKTIPAIISLRVEGGRRDIRKKANQMEAEMAAALIMSCMEQQEYEFATFGAISLLGKEQALAIEKILLAHMSVSEFGRRKILCGDPSHLQGDERDVVVLSMVDNNEGDGPLSLRTEGAGQSNKQRFNVAASRAKNQMWIIHSLDYAHDLKPGDIRRDLLEYAQNPQLAIQTSHQAKASSQFEDAIAKALNSQGFNIKLQWEAGAYKIGMVAICQGQMIAIECDGESHYSTDEQILGDIERQIVLERMGWRFIRIRGSEYYKAPKTTIRRVERELNDFGVYPEAGYLEASEAGELRARVVARARQIIEVWRQEPASTGVEEAIATLA